MIGWLKGRLIGWDGLTMLIDTGGVGYEVTVPDSVAASLAGREEVEVYVRQIFREDGTSLYGFNSLDQRRLFDLLLSVNGCGPRVAMALLAQVGEDEVIRALQSQDAQSLKRATGVGQKLAERLIVELKDKILDESFARRVVAGKKAVVAALPEDDLIDALLNLGYRRNEAEGAAKIARDEATLLSDQIRVALRELTRA